MSENRIIFLTDVIETKVRKEQELAYYEKQLVELQKKMFFVKKEIDVTNLIIEIIQQEKVVDIRDRVYGKLVDKKIEE